MYPDQKAESPCNNIPLAGNINMTSILGTIDTEQGPIIFHIRELISKMALSQGLISVSQTVEQFTLISQ